jgi:hypothetical protein
MTGGWDALILVYFVCCGVSRLARYNVTAESLSGRSGKVKYFEGTPIPDQRAADRAARVGDLAGPDRRPPRRRSRGRCSVRDLHPFALLFALSGTLMISKTLRIPKPVNLGPLRSLRSLPPEGATARLGAAGAAGVLGLQLPAAVLDPDHDLAARASTPLWSLGLIV